MIPQRLSHFELLDELGAGGMGVVYRARDLRLNRLVAVKVLPTAQQGDAERRRFLAEAQAASGINHPAVVTIHEVDADGGVDFIAMELVEGRSLAEELRRGPLPLARVLRLGAAVADGLAAAHAIGLVHRDLKPGNLMLGPGDRIKILDFGLVKRVAASGLVRADTPTAVAPESLTATGLLVGTPAYMSPEQARGESIDPRSDLFSFGCVLYEMLTARRAFAGEQPVQVLSGVLTGEPPPVEGVPPALADLLDRLLAKDRLARPASAEAVRAELEAIAGDRPVALTTSTRLAPRAASGVRSRWLIAAGAAAATVAIGAYLATRQRASAAFEFRLVSPSAQAERQGCFSPDASSLAYVSPDADGVPQIWIRNLAGGDPLQITHGERAAGRPEWSPLGDRILYELDGKEIWQIPPLGGTPRRLVESGGRPRLTADGQRLLFLSHRRIWTANADGTDAREVAGVEPLQYALDAEAVWSPDGEWIAYLWPAAERPLGDLWRVRAAGGTPERMTRLEFLAAGLDWSPDGRWIVFSSDHGGSRTLWRIAADGGPPEPVTRGAGEDSQPRLSRDGRRMIYTNQRNLHVIDRLDPVSGRRRSVVERRSAIYMPEVSHGGDRVAFFARVPGAYHLFVAPIEGGRDEQVTFGGGRINTVARWSDDDRALYYYADRPDPGLRWLDLESRRDRLLVPGWEWISQQWAALSPRGDEIAYAEREVARVVATRIRNLTTGAERELPVPLADLRWFSDGRRLVGSTLDRRIHLCDSLELSCSQVTTGIFPRVLRDDGWLYFLRLPGPVAWRLDLVSGREERLAELAGEIVPIEFSWSLLPTGEIVWLRNEPGREELWLGELP